GFHAALDRSRIGIDHHHGRVFLVEHQEATAALAGNDRRRERARAEQDQETFHGAHYRGSAADQAKHFWVRRGIDPRVDQRRTAGGARRRKRGFQLGRRGGRER